MKGRPKDSDLPDLNTVQEYHQGLLNVTAEYKFLLENNLPIPREIKDQIRSISYLPRNIKIKGSKCHPGNEPFDHYFSYEIGNIIKSLQDTYKKIRKHNINCTKAIEQLLNQNCPLDECMAKTFVLTPQKIKDFGGPTNAALLKFGQSFLQTNSIRPVKKFLKTLSIKLF